MWSFLFELGLWKLEERKLTYKDPEFYSRDYRNQFEIIDEVKVNTLPTLYDVKDFYEVHLFEDGYIAVYNTSRNYYLKPHIGDKSSPYFRYGLRTIENKSKTTYMHRLIGLWKVGGWTEDKVIDHIDTDPLNCLADNLEWVTGKVNTQRAVSNGLGVGRPRIFKIKKPKRSQLQISESSSMSRKGLTFEQVEEVFSMADKGISVTSIGKEFGVSQPCVSQILSGKRWKEHPARELYMSKLEAV